MAGAAIRSIHQPAPFSAAPVFSSPDPMCGAGWMGGGQHVWDALWGCTPALSKPECVLRAPGPALSPDCGEGQRDREWRGCRREEEGRGGREGREEGRHCRFWPGVQPWGSAGLSLWPVTPTSAATSLWPVGWSRSPKCQAVPLPSS